MWKRQQSVKPPAPEPECAVVAKPVMNAPIEKPANDLGQSLFIKGELSGSEDMTIHGQMEGGISLPDHTLTVGVRADVKADVAARAVVVLGRVTGNVIAGEKLEIRADGSVLGDVLSPRLIIADGGHLRGKVEMSKVEARKTT